MHLFSKHVVRLWLPALTVAFMAGQASAQVTVASKPASAVSNPIEPTWESLAANYKPPAWFVDGKLGVWMHWGIPSAVDENRPNDGSHYGRKMYGTVDYWSPEGPWKEGDLKYTERLANWHAEFYGPPEEVGYEDLIPNFKAEKFDADKLVERFKANGARFIMPVATHHDNFDMYDSFFPWNVVAMGPKRDVMQEWKDAATKHGLKFGVSTHLYWSPRFFKSARRFQKPGTPEWEFFNCQYHPLEFHQQDSWNEHWYARCWDVIEKYDPDMFNNDSPYPTVKHGKGLGLKLFTDFVNRDLKQNGGKQSVVLSFKNKSVDRAAFTYNLERGSSSEIQPHPWMWATDLSGNWFYRKGAKNHMTIPVMVGNAIDAISKNGIVMLNVALRGDGTLPEKQAAYLDAFGDFLRVNGEGIYGTRPWKVYGEGPLEFKSARSGENKKPFSPKDIRFTTKHGVLYAFVCSKPEPGATVRIQTLRTDGVLDKGIASVELMGSDAAIKWSRDTEGLTLNLPNDLPTPHAIGFKIKLK